MGSRVPPLWHSDLWKGFSTTSLSQTLVLLDDNAAQKAVCQTSQDMKINIPLLDEGLSVREASPNAQLIHKLLAFYLAGTLPWHAGVSAAAFAEDGEE